jgi:hypothetical protein
VKRLLLGSALTALIAIVGGFLIQDHQTEAAIPKNSAYGMNVLVLKYFPLDQSGQNIDINVTGDVGGPYADVRQHTIDVTSNLRGALARASSYRGYADQSATPALTYQIVDTLEYTTAFPIKSGTSNAPDYSKALTDNGICDYVTQHAVSEVWIWAYQGPGPQLAISESKMSGPFGDISNSYRQNDMPYCGSTYRVYTFNYGRGTAEAMESWGHQFEAELDAIDSSFFRNIFQGPNYPQILGVTGRCGSVHNPPNARSEYDRGNPTPQMSDCLNWDPDGLGSLSSISCQNWGCSDNGDDDNPPLNYMIWNWQNLPGIDNSKVYQGRPLRNFWDVHGDFDGTMGQHPTIFADEPTNTPTPSPSPTIGPCSPGSDMAELNAGNWSAWAQGSTGQNTYVLDDSSIKSAGAASLKFITDGGFDTYVSYPSTSGAIWDLRGSNYLRIGFYSQNTNDFGFQSGSPWIRLRGGGDSYFQYQYYQNGGAYDLLDETRGEWKSYLIPLDASPTEDNGWRRTSLGNPTLANVAQIEIHSDTWEYGFSLWIDGICFEPPGVLTTQTATPIPTPTVSPIVTATPTPTPTASPCSLAADDCGSVTPTPTRSPESPTPTRTAVPNPPKGDIDCNGQPEVADVMSMLMAIGGIPANPVPGCNDSWDLNCDGHADVVDALDLLLWVAGDARSLPSGCQSIGSTSL